MLRFVSLATVVAAVVFAVDAEQALSLKDRVKARRLAPGPGIGYFDVDEPDNFGANFPYGSSLCTNAGGTIDIGVSTSAVPSPLVIPTECQTHPGTTKSECAAINELWATKFSYCCPMYPDYTSHGYWPQIDITDPRGVAAFPTALLREVGVDSFTHAATWLGNGAGCRLAWDCQGLSKSLCKASAQLCSWTGVACVENPSTMATLRAAFIPS